MSDALAISLTDSARVAVAIARAIAASRGDDDLTATHVALGLLRNGMTPAVAILQESGADLHALRRELEAELKPPRRPRIGEVVLPSTPGEQQLLDQAAGESRARHRSYLGSEHLMLAILRNAESRTARAFARHGVHLDAAMTCFESLSL